MPGIDLKGRAAAQRHPEAPIEFTSDGIELLLAVAAQTGVLGEILAQQPIRVLVAAPLLRAVGIAEVHLHARVPGELGMPGHLPAPVIGQGFAHGPTIGLSLSLNACSTCAAVAGWG